jgi:hypothetical protein
MWQRIVKFAFGLTIFLVLLNLSIGFAVAPRPWHERFYITVLSAVSGGAAGTVIGLVVGGIGIAMLGTAFCIPGAIALGLSGLVVGAADGSLYTFLCEPQLHSCDTGRLVLVVLMCGSIVWVMIVLASRVWNGARARTWDFAKHGSAGA